MTQFIKEFIMGLHHDVRATIALVVTFTICFCIFFAVCNLFS